MVRASPKYLVKEESGMAKVNTNKTIKIKLIRSTIGCNKDQVATVRALGLKKIRNEVEQQDTPQIRGMINKVSHLVEVIEN